MERHTLDCLSQAYFSEVLISVAGNQQSAKFGKRIQGRPRRPVDVELGFDGALVSLEEVRGDVVSGNSRGSRTDKI